MVQYGFFFNQSRCNDCSACYLACKDWNDISPGPTRWLRVHQWEEGSFPNVRVRTVVVMCYHCENPLCVDAADGAMLKEEKYGAVLIDPEKASSPSMRRAWEACPYGAITFDSDAPLAKASMCNMCIDRLEQGLKPICVEACPQRALDFDTFENLKTKYGTNRDLPGMPSSTIVSPAVVFKPLAEKKQLVPYDANRALTLMGARQSPMPPLYTSNTVATTTEGLVSRNRLVLKPNSTSELVKQTLNDDA